MKKTLNNFLYAFSGGLVATLFLLWFVSLWPNNFFANIFFSFRSTVPKEVVRETVKEIIVKEPTFWKDIYDRAKSSMAFIQVFRGGNLIYQKSGVILTNDGIVVSPIYSGNASGGDKIQVFVEDRVYKGFAVFFDSANGLVLTKLDEVGSLKSVQLAAKDELTIAQENLLIGSYLKINKLNFFTQRSLIKELDSQVVFLDLNNVTQLTGAGLFDTSGKLVGLININKRGQVFAYQSSLLQKILESYISSLESESLGN